MAIAQPSIGGILVPNGVYNQGMYMFYPQEYEIAGDGTAIPYGTQSAIWRYEFMTPNQLDWWRWTALNGAHSRSTTFNLWTTNDRATVTAFTSGILYAPRWTEVEAIKGGFYGPVEFRFDYLLPIVFGLTPFTLGSSLLGGPHILVGAYSV
jgi:hypothetical protein